MLGEGEAWVSIGLWNPTTTVINAMLSDGAPCEDGERLMLSQREPGISTRTCGASRAARRREGRAAEGRARWDGRIRGRRGREDLSGGRGEVKEHCGA